MTDASEKPNAERLFKQAANNNWTPEGFAHEFAMGSLDGKVASDPRAIERTVEMLKSLSTSLRSDTVRALTERDFGPARVTIIKQTPKSTPKQDFKSYHEEGFRAKAQDFMHRLLACDETLATSLARGALASTNWMSARDRIPTVRLFDSLAEAFDSPDLQAKIAAKAAKVIETAQQDIAQKNAIESQLNAWIDKHLSAKGDMADNRFTKACYLARWAKALHRSANEATAH